MVAVAAKPLVREEGGATLPHNSILYAMDAHGDILVDNLSTGLSRNTIRMGVAPHLKQQRVSVVGCAPENDTNVSREDYASSGQRGEIHPCRRTWKGVDVSATPDDDEISENGSSIVCGSIFENYLSPHDMFWKGSLRGLMTVSSAKVKGEGPVAVVWKSLEKDPEGRTCVEANIHFTPSDGIATLFDVTFLEGEEERVLGLVVLGDKTKEVVVDEEDDVSICEHRGRVIIALVTILGAIGSVALLCLLREHIYMCFVCIVARTCAARFPI